MTTDKLPCFKAYDVRGRIPDELNEALAERIGCAYAAVLSPKRVVIGRDIRLSSPLIAQALIRGLTSSGVEVMDIGVCGTEQVYFATAHLGVDGGIMVTASHNPRDFNGMKFVRENAKPISGDTGLADIEAAAAKGQRSGASPAGSVREVDIQGDYIKHLLSYINAAPLGPFTVVTNAGNGGAGPIIDLLEPHLGVSFVKISHEPDGTFPSGVPNPLLAENRAATTEAVLRAKADLGIAWDGDFDRCFFFDEQGAFIEGYYIVGLLAMRMLARHPGSKIIHDPRLTWNTIDLVGAAGGIPVQCKTGHAFIKERMRAEDAVYGGEMSAHHYFRDFSYCDSGMIPWLLVLQEMRRSGKRLSELISARVAAFPASGEINRRLAQPALTLRRIKERYAAGAKSIDETDGVSIELDRWRFNVRMSNTEPVVRLNVESRGDAELMRTKTEEVLAMLV